MALPHRPRVQVSLQPPPAVPQPLGPADDQVVIGLPRVNNVDPMVPNQIIIQMQRAVAPAEPKFLLRFKEKNQYLLLAWGATLVSLAYLHAHTMSLPNANQLNEATKREMLFVMNLAAILVAVSFSLWLESYYVYERAAEDPRVNWLARLIHNLIYVAATTALSITFTTLYFPGDIPFVSAIVICVIGVLSVLFFEVSHHLFM